MGQYYGCFVCTARIVELKTATSAGRSRRVRRGYLAAISGRAGHTASSVSREFPIVCNLACSALSICAAGKTKAAADGKTKAAPKYQHPKTGATWTGHGRAPAWIAEAKDRKKFLIAGGAQATVATPAGAVSKAKTAVKKASKAVGATSTKGQPKGPQPAKYCDPKSGATWSGRGPAPTWLAGAKDRSKFLIDGAGAAADVSASTETKPSAQKAVAKKAVVKEVAATKTAPTKKVAVKKVVAKKAQKKRTTAIGYDYPLSKRTDVYAAYMYDKYSDLSTGNTYGVGIRSKF